jgi:hypothetical protein
LAAIKPAYSISRRRRAGVGGIAAFPSDESSADCVTRKSRRVRGSKTRARARTKKARPDSDGLDGWQLAAQRRAPPRAYFVFALITASDTFAGVSA